MVQPARPDGPRSDERYRHVFEDGPVGIWLVDGNLQTLEMNGAMSRMLGYTAEELGQRTFADVTHPDDIEGNLALRCQLIAGDVSTFTVEKRYVTKSGNPIWVELTVTAVRDDFNRRYMDEPLQRELARAARNHSCVAVLAIDVDHFKAFNDAYGHSAGDALLTSFGAMLRDRTRSEDIACRSGGEEFNVILPDCPLGDAVERADALRAAVKGLEVGVRGRTYGGLTISVGVAVFPDHGGDSATLLEEADTALYRAKAEGRDRVCASSGASRAE